jgi:hypothetical protein
MMRRLFLLSIFVVGLLAACAALEPMATHPALPTLSLPVPSPTFAAYPFTPVPFEPLPAYPTPEGLQPLPVVVPTQVLPAGVTHPQPADGSPIGGDPAQPFYLVGQKQIDRYCVREWMQPIMGWGIVTISTGSEVVAQIEALRLSVDNAGRDITGEGHPDVVVRMWTPAESMIGASTKVYDLGATLTQVLDVPIIWSDPTHDLPCPWFGLFADLDGDGSAEYITCDDAPSHGYYSASSHNPYAEHRRLLAMAVLDYEPGQGYVPAGPRFAHLYAGHIETYTRQVEEQAGRLARGEAGNMNDPVVALLLSYLYSGQPANAWTELDRLYDGPDKVLLWSEVLHLVSSSPFYMPGAPFPAVPVPDYYALQLTPECESYLGCPSTLEEQQPTCEPVDWLAERFAQMWGFPVSFLQEGQEAGDPAAPQRSIAWLKEELRRLGLLGPSEVLEVSLSEGGGCRLNILHADEHTLLGLVQLDMSGGFPGGVYRVDLEGKESTPWRLRGDLTWEAVPPSR